MIKVFKVYLSNSILTCEFFNLNNKLVSELKEKSVFSLSKCWKDDTKIIFFKKMSFELPCNYCQYLCMRKDTFF